MSECCWYVDFEECNIQLTVGTLVFSKHRNVLKVIIMDWLKKLSVEHIIIINIVVNLVNLALIIWVVIMD